MAQYILSDPNMSDGTHPEVIEAIMDQLRGREGMKLIGYEPDADFDRLPAEILGRPEVMREALLDMAGKAYELIDMEQQHGRHPRVGAVDTIEVYPAKGVTIDEVQGVLRGPRPGALRALRGAHLLHREERAPSGERGPHLHPQGQLRGPQGGRAGRPRTARRTSGRRSSIPRRGRPSSAPSSSTTPTSTSSSTPTTWRSPDTWPAASATRPAASPTSRAPSACRRRHRRTGKKVVGGLDRDQQPAGHADPPRLQPRPRRGGALRRQRHRRADLRHHQRRGPRARRPSGTSSSRPSTAPGTTSRRSSRTTCSSSRAEAPRQRAGTCRPLTDPPGLAGRRPVPGRWTACVPSVGYSPEGDRALRHRDLHRCVRRPSARGGACAYSQTRPVGGDLLPWSPFAAREAERSRHRRRRAALQRARAVHARRAGQPGTRSCGVSP